jgi:hypothetical protein
MAPELYATLEANELRATAQKIRDYQEARKLSFSALLKKFPDLGSDKTFNKILRGDFAELDFEGQFSRYRQVWQAIEAEGDGDTSDAELYDDLWPAVQLRRAFVETMRGEDNDRVIFLLGPSGSGKSCARRILQERYGSRLVKVEASAAWNGSPMAFLGAILSALGMRDLPMSLGDRLNKTLEKLRETRRCLLVEEAHHLGPRNLNVEVTLINQTPGEIVNIAIDSLFKKLELAAYEECRQLTGNRLAEMIRLGKDVRREDAKKLLDRRIQWANGDAKKALDLVMERAANHGRLAFVRDVCKRATRMAEGAPVTLELFTAALSAEVLSR